MEVEKREKEIVVNLTQEEVFRLQAGEMIGDRPGVTMPDAKVEILPLSAVEPDGSLKDRYSDDRLKIATEASLKGNLFQNGDLQVFVPAIKLTDVRLAGARLPKASIKTPILYDGVTNKDLVEHLIPPDGVKLNFGGTLKIMNVPDFYYK